MAARHRNLVRHLIDLDSFLLRQHYLRQYCLPLRRLHPSRVRLKVAPDRYPDCQDLRLMTEDRRPAPQLLTAILRFLVPRRCWLQQRRDRSVVSRRGNRRDVVH